MQGLYKESNLSFTNCSSSFSFLNLNSLLESLSIQQITPLIKAAKKHHTEVRYCVKTIAVTKHDNAINRPSKCVRLMLDINKGVIVAIKYAKEAISDNVFGKSFT